MGKFTKEQYEFAPARIEELLPLADNDVRRGDRLREGAFSHRETDCCSIDTALARRQAATQKQLAAEIGVGASCISDYASGRAEPTLKTARLLCSPLPIPLAAMLGC